MKETPHPHTSAEYVALIVADVYQLAALFRRRGSVIAKKIGLTQSRWQVLSAASAGNNTVAQMARRLGVSRQGVQRVADLLVDEGSARFSSNPDNVRSPHVQLTKRGKSLLEALTQAAENDNKDLAEGLTDQDLQRAAIVLRKFCMQIETDLRKDKG